MLCAIEASIAAIYDLPKTRHDETTGVFFMKLDDESKKTLQQYTHDANITNLAGAFKICFEKGLNLASPKNSSDLSISRNKDRVPKIYEAWLKGDFGDNLQTPYVEAMDLLEKNLNG